MAAVVCAVSCKKQEQPTSEPEQPGTEDDTEVVELASVSLDKTTLTLKVGETSQLVAEILPENADNKDIEWSVDDSEVASVEAGLVTALKEGTAVVTVTTEDGGKTATCEVTVTSASSEEEEEIIGPDSVVIDSDEYELNVGQEYDMLLYDLIVTGQADANLEIVWTSTNSEVAVVENNKIIAKKFGTTTIRAAAKYGDEYDECVVNVYDLPTDIEFYIGETELKASEPYGLEVGDEFTVTAKIQPETANQNAWYFTLDDLNQDVLQTDEINPTFKVLKAGTVEINFCSEFGGFWHTIRFEIPEPFTITPEATSGWAGSTIKINASESLKSWSLNLIKGGAKMGTRKVEAQSDGKSAIVSLAMHELLGELRDMTYTVTAVSESGKSATCSVTSKAWKMVLFNDSEPLTAMDTENVGVGESYRLYVGTCNDDGIAYSDWSSHINAVFGSEGAYTTSVVEDLYVKFTFEEGAESYKIVLSSKNDPTVLYEQNFTDISL